MSAKPYYEHAGITIYHGDCREVPCFNFDVIVCDPPYGLGIELSRRGCTTIIGDDNTSVRDCEFDAGLRTPEQIKRFHGELYVHASCIPLVQIDLVGLVAERAEGNIQQSLWANECEGMCGV